LFACVADGQLRFGSALGQNPFTLKSATLGSLLPNCWTGLEPLTAGVAVASKYPAWRWQYHKKQQLNAIKLTRDPSVGQAMDYTDFLARLLSICPE